jgi:ankyrin repeat protein
MLSQEIIDHVCTYLPLEKAWCFSPFTATKMYNPVIHSANYWIKIKDPSTLRFFLENNIISKHDMDKLWSKACQHSRTDILQLLIDYGVDPKSDKVAIKFAACNNQLGTLKFLLSLGRKVNEFYNEFSYIVQIGKCEAIRFLLENNHISVKNDTEYIGVAFGQLNINTINLLLEYGSTFVINDNADWLPSACHFCEIEIVKLLLERGIDPTINDNRAIKIAKEKNYLDIVDLLLEYGCKL